MNKFDFIRLNANAAIVKNGKILLIEFKDQNGVHYNLPGGGVDVGESIEAALMRECFEEAKVKVKVGRLLLIWEYVPKIHKNIYGRRQKVGHIFKCQLKAGSIPAMPKNPDKNQVGVKWISLKKLLQSEDIILYPSIKKELVAALQDEALPITVISRI